MTTATTHFGRVVAIFAALESRDLDPDTLQARMFMAWIGTVMCVLDIKKHEVSARLPVGGAPLDDHAMRLTIRELTEAARAVPAPENVADDWHEAIDALACVAGALCNSLPRHAEAMVSSLGGAA